MTHYNACASSPLQHGFGRLPNSPTRPSISTHPLCWSCRPEAKEALARLDWKRRLGMSPNFPNDQANKKPNGYDVMMRGKINRPYAIILVRVRALDKLPRHNSRPR